jgi:2-keto-4-pentenoate hydratase/2-oxohepta-3-ene-1,7-dioic acid hydratase in catechol pathway
VNDSSNAAVQPWVAPELVAAGVFLETMRFLKSGDVVELEVEGIGILRNRVIKQD